MNLIKFKSTQRVFIKIYIKNSLHVLVIIYLFHIMPNILIEQNINVVKGKAVNNKTLISQTVK